MNTKGKPSNLVASHKENRNAEKAGVYSPRRRAEEAAKVTARMAQDPAGYLRAELEELYADARGFHELLKCDVAENGVSDRHGNPRRQVGTLQKQIKLCIELLERLRAISGAGDSDASYRQEPWSEEEGLNLLRSWAHDSSVPAPTRFAANRFLLAHKGHSDQRSFRAHVDAASDEQVARMIVEYDIEAVTRDLSPEDSRIHDLMNLAAYTGAFQEGQYEELLAALVARIDPPDIVNGKTAAAGAVPSEQ